MDLLTLTPPAVHFILKSAVTTEVPLLLRGVIPDPPSSQIGTSNWSTPPKAIVFGGAFGESDIAELRALVANVDGTRRIPWVYVDGPKPRPPVAGNEVGFAAFMAQRFKEGLNKLKEQGKFDRDGDDGVYTV